jgi:hypothetical protein
MNNLFHHDTKKFGSYKVAPNVFAKAYNDDFYKVDKSSLLLVRKKEDYLSDSLIKEVVHSDSLLLKYLLNNFNKLAYYVSGKKPSVVLESEKQASFAQIDGSAINIDISPLYDHRINIFTRVNTIFAVTCHEAFHIKYTTPEIGQLLVEKGYCKTTINNRGEVIYIPDFQDYPKLINKKLVQNLMNILEDKRIEEKGLQRFSGYVYYFDEHKKYAGFLHQNALKTSPFSESDSCVTYDYNFVLKYILFKVLLPDILPLVKDEFPDPSREVSVQHLVAPGLTFQMLYTRIDLILSQDCNTFKDVLKVTEELLELFPEDIHDKLGNNSSNSLTGEFKIKLKNADSEELLKIAEEIEGDDQIKTIKLSGSDNSKEYLTYKLHPSTQGNFDYTIYNEAVGLARSMKNNLSFLDSRLNRIQESFELQNGEIDEDELFSIKYNNNIFYETEEAQGYNLDFAVLIDESGSMGSITKGRYRYKIDEAKIAALGLALSLINSNYINLYLYGHSTSNEGMELFEYINTKENKRNVSSLFNIKYRQSNVDGYAIKAMGDILSKSNAKQKVLIVISDGQPAGVNYCGELAEKHVKQVVESLEKQNVFVIQVAVDSVNSSKMFKHYIPFSDKDLGVNLKKILMKKLIEISNIV